jgi:hypothetical protein
LRTNHFGHLLDSCEQGLVFRSDSQIVEHEGIDVRGKFDRPGRAAGEVSRSDVHAKQHGLVTRADRQAIEAYLAKMRFVTGQPPNNFR